MKRIIGLFFIGLLLFPTPVLADFSDVRTGSQLESYIEYLVEKGIISGYPDGSFKPEKTINRAEALKIIFETIGTNAGSNTNSGFPDVPSHEWFAKYVTAAKAQKIIAGYPDGKFRPTQEVNRAEFIKMAMSALPFFNETSQDKAIALQQYSDVYDLWYIPYVSAGLHLGYLSKTSELKPTAPMQRQDAVEIVYRISQYLNEHSSSSNGIPSSPEEDVVVIDPTLEHSYNPESFGPEKLIVKKDIGKTEIYNIVHGYNLVVNDLVDVTALENSPHEIRLSFPEDCLFDIYVDENSSGLSAESFYRANYPQLDHDGMIRVRSTKLFKLTEYADIQAYRVQTVWEDDDTTQSYFAYSPSVIYQFNSIEFGGATEQQCDALIPQVLSNFKLR